jgi:hypothetical protein
MIVYSGPAGGHDMLLLRFACAVLVLLFAAAPASAQCPAQLLTGFAPDLLPRFQLQALTLTPAEFNATIRSDYENTASW